MANSHIFKNHVWHNGVAYEPGDDVPSEIADEIDPNNFAENELDALGEEGEAYAALSKKELDALLKERELPLGGSAADKIRRLIADDKSGS